MPWSLLSRILRRPNRPPALVGTWHLERSEDPEADPGVEIDVLPDGRMQYSIPASDRWQIIQMTWCVENEWILTDQPSSPRVEKTRFRLESDDSLVLEFSGHQSWFRRGAKRAPAA